MGTIVTVLIVIYFIVVLFIMIEKKIDSLPRSRPEGSDENPSARIDAYKKRRQWVNFAAGLSDTPSSKIPCRPLDE
ncbi:MAG: hypothetical protein ACOZF0_12920 [Thermodesulfobacteriota bacterium]